MNRPPIFLTTNVVGGLGNQLFLLANLYATALRVSSSSPQQQQQVVAYVNNVPESSSCHAPRPTYWKHTPFMKNVNELILDAKDAARIMSSTTGSQPSAEAVTIPERGAAAAPFTLEDIQKASSTQHATSHCNFVGFFQSDRYFSDLRHQVVDTLLPPELFQEGKKQLSATYQQQPQQQQQHRLHTVALHVRRGDYLLLKETFEIQSYEYYCRALESLYGSMLLRSPQAQGNDNSGSSSASSASSPFHFGARTGNSPLFRVLVFSEDKAFAQTLCGALNVKYPTVVASVVNASDDSISSSSSSSSSNDWKSLPQDVREMILMSACDDVVAANSSFSWWAGYFATTHHSPLCRVVAPQRWFVGKQLPEMTHVYPSNWIVV